MMTLILDDTKDKMSKAIESLSANLNTLRSGRANANLLNGIEIDYYGEMTPISQMASISIQEGRIIVIKPFDKSVLKGIEHAINVSNLGLPPNSDGTMIRLTIPALTGETRKSLCKDVKKFAEASKVAIRNVRRDANDDAKKEESFTEDVEKNCLEKIQKLTDESIVMIDQIADAKEKEIMTV